MYSSESGPLDYILLAKCCVAGAVYTHIDGFGFFKLARNAQLKKG